jgi:hypothetical protein
MLWGSVHVFGLCDTAIKTVQGCTYSHNACAAVGAILQVWALTLYCFACFTSGVKATNWRRASTGNKLCASLKVLAVSWAGMWCLVVRQVWRKFWGVGPLLAIDVSALHTLVSADQSS